MILHKRKKFSFFAIVKTLAFVFSFVALGASVIVFAGTSDSYTTKLKITVVEAGQDDPDDPPVGPVDPDPEKEDESGKSGGKSAIISPDTGTNTNDTAGANKSRAFVFLALSFAFTILYFVVLKKRKAKLCFSSERNVSSKATNLVVALLPIVATLFVCVSTTENSKAFADINSSNTQVSTLGQVDIRVVKGGEVAIKKDTVSLRTDAKVFNLYAYVKNNDRVKSSGNKIIPEGDNVLGGDVWGYSIDNGSNFSKLPVISTSNPKGKHVSGKTLNDGKNKQANVDMSYGIKASDDLPVGSYEGTVSYTVITDMQENGSAERTSAEMVYLEGGEQLNIKTSLQEYGDMDLGTPEVKVGGDVCQNVSIQKDSNTKFINVSCMLPAKSVSQKYDVNVKIPSIDWEYTIRDGIRYIDPATEGNIISAGSKSCILYYTSTDGSVNSNKSKENSVCLQSIIDEANKIAVANNNTQQVINIPAARYDFAWTGMRQKKENGQLVDNTDIAEYYCVKLKSYVKIVGKGNVDGNVLTDDLTNSEKFAIFYPYDGAEFYEGSSVSAADSRLDMFYFNDYADHSFGNDGKNYLENADFENIVIDGRHSTNSRTSTTAGNGFMVNLVKDSDWKNVAVLNMDGTGFGIGSPINSTIKDSVAAGCGKKIGGRSGFGISTGYVDNESLTIENSRAYYNNEYGFYFGHSAKWSDKYQAKIIGNNTAKFVVKNSSAGLNSRDYGGERANNVYYYNDVSDEADNYKRYISSGLNTREHADVAPVFFGDLSTNVYINNLTVAYTYNLSSARVDDVKWALGEGIVTPKNVNDFGEDDGIKRGEALSMMWRYFNRTNAALDDGSSSLHNAPKIYYKTEIAEFDNHNYKDVPRVDRSNSTDVYIAADWALDKGITKGADSAQTAGLELGLNDNCDRTTFVVFLYRLWKANTGKKATKPSGYDSFYNYIKEEFGKSDESDEYDADILKGDSQGDNEKLEAVSWAHYSDIVRGTKGGPFNPNGIIEKIDAISLLYRYNELSEGKPNTPSI